MLLMENIDANILNIAIPTMATELLIPVLNLKLSVTSYLVGLAIFIPISGWIADHFGTKKVLLWSISLFTICSLLCAIVSTLHEIVIFRFLQGVSGAFMVPVGRLLLLKTFGKDQLVRVYILMAMPVILGPLIAPLVGGYIVTYLSWRYIFLVNIPFGVLAFIASVKYVMDYKQETQKFNFVSFAFLGAFLALFSFFLDVLFFSFAFKYKVYLLLVSLILFGIYLWIELRSTNRVINYTLFRIETFRLSFWSNFFLRLAFGGRAFVFGLFLQIGLHMSAHNAGYLLSSFVLGLFLSRSLVKPLLRQYGFKILLTVSNIGAFIGLVLMCFITKISIYAVCVIIFHSAFSSMSFILLNILGYADVPEEEYASATSLMTSMQQLCSAIGVVVAGAGISLFNLTFNVELSRGVFIATLLLIGIISLSTQPWYSRLNRFSGAHLIK